MNWRPISYSRTKDGWEVEIELIPLLLCVAIAYAIVRFAL